MRVLMVSKALVVAAYRRKLTELARLGSDVVAVVPEMWREGGSVQYLEPGSEAGYRLLVSPVRWNGHFHLHHYPDLPRLIRRVQPDIVHLDEEPYNLATYLGVRAARACQVPVLFFTWQNLLQRYPFPFAQMEHGVYRTAASAIAGNRNAAEVLRQKGFTKPVSVAPQFGVDPEVFAPASCFHEHFTVGFLNRLVPAKAPLLVLDAFTSLPGDARLYFVGDGPLRGRLEAEVQRRGLGGRVTVRERVPSAQIPDMIRSLDTVVLPSLTTPRWKEQFGRVLVEAMACGVPVVGSDSGEIPFVVGDGGLVVPEGDRQALAEALKKLYDQSDLRHELGKKGRQRVLEHFTHARIAQLTHDAYAAIYQ